MTSWPTYRYLRMTFNCQGITSPYSQFSQDFFSFCFVLRWFPTMVCNICHLHRLLFYLCGRWSDGNLIFCCIVSHAIFLFYLPKVSLSHTKSSDYFALFLSVAALSFFYLNRILSRRSSPSLQCFSCEKFLEA